MDIYLKKKHKKIIMKRKKLKLKEMIKKDLDKYKLKKINSKPIVIGLIFDLTPDHEFFEKLKSYKIQSLIKLPANPFESKENESKFLENNESPKKYNIKPVPDSLLPELVKFIHGNSKGILKLINEFHSKYENISKLQLEKKIKEIATKEKVPGNLFIWTVHQDILKNLNLDIPLYPNQSQLMFNCKEISSNSMPLNTPTIHILQSKKKKLQNDNNNENKIKKITK
jgi:hypothetical protein